MPLPRCQAYALLEEQALNNFPNDFKVDLAACCTKGDKASCVSELSDAYAKVHAFKINPEENAEPVAGAGILSGLLGVIRKRIKKDQLGSEAYQKIYDACGESAACTPESVTKIRKEGNLGAGGGGEEPPNGEPVEEEDPSQPEEGADEV